MRVFSTHYSLITNYLVCHPDRALQPEWRDLLSYSLTTIIIIPSAVTLKLRDLRFFDLSAFSSQPTAR
jgi:hypothetical protein